MVKTAAKAKDIFGSKRYQCRARKALPILIRQAQASQEIYYEDLAEELGMPNPRNLNYPLGSIGVTINALREKWHEDIPHIESLVVNQSTGMPGSGLDEFIEDGRINYSSLGNRKKKIYHEAYWSKIYAYPSWHKVLKELGLNPFKNAPTNQIGKVTKGRGGGGEGPEHLALKNYILNTPKIVGLSAKHPSGKAEYDLLSGDKIDVVFEHRKKLTAVEVKSRISDQKDIIRGLYQCIKYKAVLEAQQGVYQTDYNIQVFLVLEGDFPKSLIGMRNCLGIRVIDNIKPK